MAQKPCVRCGKPTLGDRGDDLCWCDEMLFDEYQELAIKTAREGLYNEIMYRALGLAGEAGEVANEIKKVFRDDGGRLTEDRKSKVLGELGDVLWYLASLAKACDISLSDIATYNLEKLHDRYGKK